MCRIHHRSSQTDRKKNLAWSLQLPGKEFGIQGVGNDNQIVILIVQYIPYNK